MDTGHLHILQPWSFCLPLQTWWLRIWLEDEELETSQELTCKCCQRTDMIVFLFPVSIVHSNNERKDDMTSSG
jgi:hypothetical protein